jgi:ABC-type uncharacterized transport system substrate-binding protein
VADCDTTATTSEAADHRVLGFRCPFFHEGLDRRLCAELHWVVGSTVAIEYRWAEARNDRFAELAAEFVRLKVDAIVTAGTPSVLALMQATSSIPIVFVAVGDPVKSTTLWVESSSTDDSRLRGALPIRDIAGLV